MFVLFVRIRLDPRNYLGRRCGQSLAKLRDEMLVTFVEHCRRMYTDAYYLECPMKML
jgi:hypothetical protein